MHSFQRYGFLRQAALALLLLLPLSICVAQKKPVPQPKGTPAPAATDLSKLRDEYIKATKDYKASLQKLLSLYKDNVKKAEKRHEQMQKLLAEGLVAKREVEEVEVAVTEAKVKVSGVEQQIAGADTQMANVIVEIEGERQLAKLGPARKNSLVKTTSYIRFMGAGRWLLSQSNSIQSFFQQTFNRPLPVAVFGQGAIHDRWRLDHRNAMDISLHPDGPEGQALIKHLQSNGVPFLAFRGAIPGVATGPHIHIGLPSHRY